MTVTINETRPQAAAQQPVVGAVNTAGEAKPATVQIPLSNLAFLGGVSVNFGGITISA